MIKDPKTLVEQGLRIYIFVGILEQKEFNSYYYRKTLAPVAWIASSISTSTPRKDHHPFIPVLQKTSQRMKSSPPYIHL